MRKKKKAQLASKRASEEEEKAAESTTPTTPLADDEGKEPLDSSPGGTPRDDWSTSQSVSDVSSPQPSKRAYLSVPVSPAMTASPANEPHLRVFVRRADGQGPARPLLVARSLSWDNFLFQIQIKLNLHPSYLFLSQDVAIESIDELESGDMIFVEGVDLSEVDITEKNRQMNDNINGKKRQEQQWTKEVSNLAEKDLVGAVQSLASHLSDLSLSVEQNNFFLSNLSMQISRSQQQAKNELRNMLREQQSKSSGLSSSLAASSSQNSSGLPTHSSSISASISKSGKEKRDKKKETKNKSLEEPPVDYAEFVEKSKQNSPAALSINKRQGNKQQGGDKDGPVSKILAKSEHPRAKYTHTYAHLQCIHTFSNHSGPIWCLKVTSDILISGSSDMTIKLWDLSTLRHLKTLEGHTGIVHCLDVWRGKYLFSGSADKCLRIWDLNEQDRKCINALYCHNNTICELLVNDTHLFTGSYNEIKVWSLKEKFISQKWRPIHVLSGHNHWVYSMAFYDRTLLSGSHNMLKVWNIDSFTEVRTVSTAHGKSVYSLAIAGNYLISGTYENTVNVYHLDSLDEAKTLMDHQACVLSLAVAGHYFFSGSYDTTIKVWNADTLQCIDTLYHMAKVEALVTARDYLISGGTDSSIKVWAVPDKEKNKE